MSVSMCLKHQCVDEPENPCLVCVIEGIYETSRSRDGSAETDDAVLRNIRDTCEKVLKLLDAFESEVVEMEFPEDVQVEVSGGCTTVRRGDWSIDWEHIGEGVCGDFNEKDPDDEPRLRAYLLYKDHSCSKGSYCTMAPVGTSVNDLVAASIELFDKLEIPKEFTPDEEVRFNHRAMELWTHREYPAIARDLT